MTSTLLVSKKCLNQFHVVHQQKQLFGTLQVKINEAILARELVDHKVRDYLDQGSAFDRGFFLYLKLHSRMQHMKSSSSSNGKLISREIY